MSLPDVLKSAGEHLHDAQTAMYMARVANLLDDERSMRQFTSEAEAATRHAQSLMDQYLTFGDTPQDDCEGGF